MSAATEGGGLRKRQVSKFVQIPRETIRDSRLSWKARGLLGFLLDLPDGWEVRATWLKEQGPDGRDSVQAGLRELRAAGYYRVEKRRLPGGTFCMGTAVSDVAVASWASEYAEQLADAAAGAATVEVAADGTITDPEDPLAVTERHEQLALGNPATGNGFPVSGEEPTGNGLSDVGSPGRRETRPHTETGEGETEDGGVQGGRNVTTPRADVGHPPTPSRSSRIAPSGRCEVHEGLAGLVPPCNECRDAARELAVWQEQRAVERRAQEAAGRAAARAARAVRAAEVQSCRLCDDGGRMRHPLTLVCTHDQARNDAAIEQRGVAMAAAKALGTKNEPAAQARKSA